MSARQNRYNQTIDDAGRLPLTQNFVAAGRDVEPVRVEHAPIATADTSAVWMPTASPSRDSVSAQDRAKGFIIRQVPSYVVTLTIALVGTIAYTLIAMEMDVSAPWALDRLLVFLVSVAVVLMVSHSRADGRDYDHSHAGIERRRIDAAVEIRSKEIDAELELRTKALEAQLRMLELQNNDSEGHRRPRLSDRGQS